MNQPIKTFELQVSVYLRSQQGDQLQINETFNITAQGFLDLAKILSEFHDLAKAIADNRQPEARR